jgi:hypothetical protein
MTSSNKASRQWVYIDGYWMGDMNRPFTDYLCSIGREYSEEKDALLDDQVFYYFGSTKEFKSYCKTAPDFKDREDTEFVITKHRFIKNPFKG